LPRREALPRAPYDPSTAVLLPLIKGLGRAFRHLVLNPLWVVVVCPYRRINGPWLGLDCRTAIGHDARLSLHGYRVYDDFPAKRSTIDHIAVGPHGVFAIETRGRTAAEARKGASGVRMIYDGQTMPNPVWVEAASLDQAQRHARWLSRWLSSGIGQAVDVHPMLAFPGWLTNRGRWADVVLVNKRDYESLTTRQAKRLSEAVIERIDRELERRYRDVELAGP